ncbi:hypothetical protein [Daejeonella sp.]|uniref:hypothetical protein n=1 Tax=Daejeonella sp. TaxID=2805397 RepID=UPI00271A2072|nr:hypothetical protein [Daejeonella sp.]MDO8991479.1 hypothetical protein [Daejeonella sp.]MDP2415775.1 hypothetical protein [Daejeonella sp.]
MKAFTMERVAFICRAKENRKFVELESFMAEGQDLDMGESRLIRDCKVQLYTGILINNKRGNKHYREELVESHFRLVVVESKAR